MKCHESRNNWINFCISSPKTSKTKLLSTATFFWGFRINTVSSLCVTTRNLGWNISNTEGLKGCLKIPWKTGVSEKWDLQLHKALFAVKMAKSKDSCEKVWHDYLPLKLNLLVTLDSNGAGDLSVKCSFCEPVKGKSWNSERWLASFSWYRVTSASSSYTAVFSRIFAFSRRPKLYA